jgi:Coatomer WD associated region.
LNCIKVDGYENCEDADVHPSMIAKRTDFLLFLASGDLDRALICATHIKDISVWIRLGMACIKEENYKIARDCLENMDDRKNLLSIQPTIMDSVEGCREEFVFAELAIKLGMIGKASKICKKCDRMDILCNILKHHGLWNEAFDAAKNIPVLEKSLYFHYGKFMEDLGNINEAVTFYMKSSLPRRSLIPKMLHMGCDVERFAMESNDKELITL